MKIIRIILLILPLIMYCQNSTFQYTLSKNKIEVITESDTIKYDYKTDKYEFGNSSMKDNIFQYSLNQFYDFKRNTIKVNQKEYVFKRPIFSKKTILIDKFSNKKLLNFTPNYKNKDFNLEVNENFYNIVSESDQKVLKKWALMKQAQYVYYNSENLSEYVIFGSLVGALGGFL